MQPYRIVFCSGYKVFLYARSREHAINSALELWPRERVRAVQLDGLW